MPIDKNKLDQLEHMTPQERVKTFGIIHESEDEAINNLLSIVVRSSSKIAFEYLTFLTKTAKPKNIENLHTLISNPRFRFREKSVRLFG